MCLLWLHRGHEDSLVLAEVLLGVQCGEHVELGSLNTRHHPRLHGWHHAGHHAGLGLARRAAVLTIQQEFVRSGHVALEGRGGQRTDGLDDSSLVDLRVRAAGRCQRGRRSHSHVDRAGVLIQDPDHGRRVYRR